MIVDTPGEWGYTFTCDLVECEITYQIGATTLKEAAQIFVRQNKFARVNLNTGEVHCGDQRYHPQPAPKPVTPKR